MRFTTTDNPRAARAEVLQQHLIQWEREWLNNDAAAFVAQANPDPEVTPDQYRQNQVDIEAVHEAALVELAELGIVVEIKAETPPTPPPAAAETKEP